MTATAAAQSKLAAWKLATRLPTLPAAIAPVIVGSAVAHHRDEFALLPALAAMAGALLLQVGANYANDVFDFQRGADTPGRLGPPRATQTGALAPRELYGGIAVVFALALICGVYLTAVAGWPVVVIGLAGMAAALFYTGGPWPIGYHALGDLFTFVFFGLVAVLGTEYVQAGDVSRLGLLAAVPMGCSVTAILVVNNLRDRASDRTAGKTTLAVLLGDRLSRLWYCALATVPYLVLLLAWPFGPLSVEVLLVLLSLPASVPPLRAVLSGVSGRPLNQVLRSTARWHLALGVAVALVYVAA